ncbi:glycosyltransferase family 4 protein [Mucisphaera sp.]|uniref:glycosyltransferase family 4 protein n=1 Tax=Mucisphaera sp. TaxID=2913024 RepID=UPI003D14EC02
MLRTDRLKGLKALVVHPRRHHLYQTARAYQEAGRLAHFLTNTWVGQPSRLKTLRTILPSNINRKVQKLSDYHDATLAPSVILRSRNLHHVAASKLLGVNHIIHDQAPLPDLVTKLCNRNNWALHMPCNHALNTFRLFKGRGLPLILEQYICDRRQALTLLQQETERFGIEMDKASADTTGLRSCDINEEEYELADIIVAGSEFVAESLRKARVPEHKIILAQYGVDTAIFQPNHQPRQANTPLNVAFVGSGAIRKGLLYLLEAASQLGPSQVRIQTFGNTGLPEQFVEKYQDILVQRGHLSRSELVAELANCHAMALPSLAEGSALSVYEGLAAGLPAIVTPNTSSIVEHGETGFVVPIRNSEAIEQALLELIQDDNRRLHMAKAARQAAEAQTWTRYRESLRNGLGI